MDDKQPLLLKVLPKDKLKNLLELHLLEAKSRELEVVQLLKNYLNNKDERLLIRTSIKLGSFSHELSSALNQLMWQIGLRYVLPSMKSRQEFRNNFETKHDFPILNVGTDKPSQLYKRFEVTRTSIESLNQICTIIENFQPRKHIRKHVNELSFMQALSEIRNSKAHTMIVEPNTVAVAVKPKDNFGNEISWEEAQKMGYEIAITWDSVEFTAKSHDYPTYYDKQCWFLKDPLEVRKFYFKIPDNENVSRCIFCYTKGVMNNVQNIMIKVLNCLD